MCGICGFTGEINPQILRKMASVLAHRGPDDEGYWEHDQLSLGFRRLSIVDLQAGGQPVFNEDGAIVVVFNGEIYNHLALRNLLIKQGHRFTSEHADSEVIPHLYEEYGLDFPQYLNGMFSIALWDRREKRLLLVRDRVGIKPLYYAKSGGDFVFGSEVKSILQFPGITPRPNYEALYHYFSFKNTPAPLTAFEGIQQLLPGEMIIIQNGIVRHDRWWELNVAERRSSMEESASALRALLDDSVRLQMNADVEVGAYLSGGLDSSSVVALMSQHASNKIKTFTLTYEEEFENKSQDKINAQHVSEMFGTEHYEYVMTEQDFWSGLDSVASAFDEPFSGVTSTFFLTSLIAKHVKVTLSGDGADELFGSYLPHRLATPLAQFSGMSEEERHCWSHAEFNKENLAAMLESSEEASRRMSLYLWNDNDKITLFTNNFKERVRHASTENIIAEYFNKGSNTDPLNRTLNVDFHTLLPDQVLTFVDRLSMAHSVEVRPPFLDHRIVELAFSIEGQHKIANNDVKLVLKQAVKDLLPESIINRPKEGFVMPVNYWLQRDRCNKVATYINEESIRSSGVLSWDAVKPLRAMATQGDSRAQMRLWNIMMFQVWWEAHF